MARNSSRQVDEHQIPVERLGRSDKIVDVGENHIRLV
jgi:hypothetical protein